MASKNQNPINLVLAASLKELVVSRPIEKITIKEITDRAGVIRPTFYNHFQDKYELLEWIVENDLFAPVDPFFANGMLKEAITFILTTIEKEKSFYQKAVLIEGQNSFNDMFSRCVVSTIAVHLDKDKIQKMFPYKWVTVDLVADFYARAICYGTIEWVKMGMRVPVDEMVTVFLSIFNKSVLEMISDVK